MKGPPYQITVTEEVILVLQMHVVPACNHSLEETEGQGLEIAKIE